MPLLPFPGQVPWSDINPWKGLPSQTFKQYLSALDTFVKRVFAAGDYLGNQPWTPSDQSGAGLVFAAVNVGWSQSGNMVFVYGRFTFPATASPALVLIGGLPIPVPNSVKASLPCTAFSGAGFAFPIEVTAVGNTSNFIAFNALTGAQLTNAQMTGALLDFNLMYPAAA